MSATAMSDAPAVRSRPGPTRALLVPAAFIFLAAAAAPAQAHHGAEPAGGAALLEVVLATGGAVLATAALFALGFAYRRGRAPALARAAGLSERISGLPGWTSLPAALAAVALLTALLGMYWDISLHIDVGRDPGPLANPAHYLILVGLFGVFCAGVLAIFLPTGPARPGPAAVRIRGDWYAPVGGVLMAACGAFALIGFPLDDVWHRLFGQDVTLWGPTHLMLIGGAAMTLIGQAVLLTEGARSRRGSGQRLVMPSWVASLRRVGIAGGLLIGLSTFQAEFDFGVPQFRLVFQPLLIAVAAGMALVAARVWIGPGGAIGAAAFFLGARGLVALVVGPVLGETTPHLPLYLGEAVLVELVALVVSARGRPLAFGASAGLLAGTAGMASEWGWSHLWMPIPWPSAILPEAAVLAALGGLAGGALGALMGAALRGELATGTLRVRLAVGLAALAVAGTIGYALPSSPAKGVSASAELADVRGGADRAVEGTFRIDPPAAADGAEWVSATAWQGGGLVVDRLRRVRAGVYRTTQPIPVHGEWKALLRLHRGDSLSAIPIYLPADRAIPAPAVPALAGFTREFVPDKRILQRESKAGVPGALRVAGPLVVLAIALSLLALLAWGVRRLSVLSSAAAPTPPSRGSRRQRGARRPTLAPTH